MWRLVSSKGETLEVSTLEEALAVANTAHSEYGVMSEVWRLDGEREILYTFVPFTTHA